MYSLDDCQVCCDESALSSAFNQVTFSVSTCKEQGCNREIGENQFCQDLFASNLSNSDRLGCEIGRDFRFTGVTPLLDSEFPTSTALIQCVGLNPVFGREAEISNQDFGILETVSMTLPNETLFLRDSDQCSDCCSNTNSLFDRSDPDLADDFTANSCRSTCVDLDFCFEEESHRDRLGCLLALDFRDQGSTSLKDGIIICEDDGTAVLLSQTNFPTASPTLGEVLDDDDNDDEEEEDDEDYDEDDLDDSSLLVVLVIVFFFVLLACVSVAFMLGRRIRLGKEQSKRSLELLEGSGFPGSRKEWQAKKKNRESNVDSAFGSRMYSSTSSSQGTEKHVLMRIESPTEEVVRSSPGLQRFNPHNVSLSPMMMSTTSRMKPDCDGSTMLSYRTGFTELEGRRRKKPSHLSILETRDLFQIRPQLQRSRNEEERPQTYATQCTVPILPDSPNSQAWWDNDFATSEQPFTTSGSSIAEDASTMLTTQFPTTQSQNGNPQQRGASPRQPRRMHLERERQNGTRVADNQSNAQEGIEDFF